MAVDAGATAWVLASTCLVLLMTPAVAMFYGGLVRAKNVLGMLMQNFTVIALVSTVWVIAGYSLAFGRGNAFVGDLTFAGLADMTIPVPGYTGATRAGDPADRLRRLPDDVRRDHRRADHRGDRRPVPVRGLRRLHPAVEPAGLLTGRALGVLADGLGVRAGGAGLRGRHGGARQRRGVGAGDGHRPRPQARLARRRHARAQHATGDAGHRPAVVRLVRVQRRVAAPGGRRGRHRAGQHPRRGVGRAARLDRRRAPALRQVHHARRRVRRGGRPRRDHTVRRLRQPGRGDRGRGARRLDLRLRRQPEAAGARRRLARRGGRPPDRRDRRLARGRPVRHPRGEPRRRGRPVLRRWVRAARPAAHGGGGGDRLLHGGDGPHRRVPPPAGRQPGPAARGDGRAGPVPTRRVGLRARLPRPVRGPAAERPRRDATGERDAAPHAACPAGARRTTPRPGTPRPSPPGRRPSRTRSLRARPPASGGAHSR